MTAERWQEIKFHIKENFGIEATIYDKKNNEGIVISSAAPIKDKLLYYTVLGKNKKRAYQLEQDMLELLNKIN